MADGRPDPFRAPVRVRCATWAQFLDLYARDLGQGALFLATEQPASEGTEITIQVECPGGAVQLGARVERVFRAGDGASPVPGMRLVLDALEGERQVQLEHLVAMALRHRPPPSPGDAPRLTPVSPHVSAPPGPDGADAARPSLAELAAPLQAGPGAEEEPEPLFQASPDQESLIPVWTESLLPSLEPPAQPADDSGGEGESLPVLERVDPISLLAPGGVAEDEAEQAPGASLAQQPPSVDDPRPPPPGASPRLAAELLLKRALRLVAHKDYRAGIDLLRDAVQTDPESRQAAIWLRLAQARYAVARDDVESAVRHYEAVLALDEHHYESVRELRKLSARQKKGFFKRLWSR